MFRNLIILSVGLFSLNASADGFNNAVVLARLNSYFTQTMYQGVDLSGGYCKVTVVKSGSPSLGGEIFITGEDLFPMPQVGNNLLRESGFFQLGASNRVFIVQDAQFTNDVVSVKVYVPNPTHPTVYGIGEWSGTITLHPSVSGHGLGSIAIDEQGYDPVSNQNFSRSYYCGERLQ